MKKESNIKVLFKIAYVILVTYTGGVKNIFGIETLILLIIKTTHRVIIDLFTLSDIYDIFRN